jgi:GNAT superfamily N-acetyltransferase
VLNVQDVMTVRVATSDSEIAGCFPVVVQLRPHLKRQEFVGCVRRMQRAGYRLAYLEANGLPVAVAGYRISYKLSAGPFLYVDDLVTDEPERSKGYGSHLLRWLVEQARAAGCSKVLLDTGVQRTDAQRFYDREGLRVAGYHYHYDVG